jgi:hypothetical protein
MSQSWNRSLTIQLVSHNLYPVNKSIISSGPRHLRHHFHFHFIDMKMPSIIWFGYLTEQSVKVKSLDRFLGRGLGFLVGLVIASLSR